MRSLRNIKWLPLLMVLSILAIAAFQYYWLDKAYDRERRILERQTNMLFRETVANLQASKLKIDRFDSSMSGRIVVKQDTASRLRTRSLNQKAISMMNIMVDRYKDSGEVYIKSDSNSRLFVKPSAEPERFRSIHPASGRGNRVVQFLFDLDSLQDSLTVKEIETTYARRLEEQNLDVPFNISRIQPTESKEPVFNEVTIGFRDPVAYRIELGNTTGFLLGRIASPILFSIFLVGFTIFSFAILYRNLQKQRKLADIKNEFISNITHELKTPIATVSVAIEALRSFNASLDATRTKEYLDISANELQRLSLLVDKVLKLTMFEKKEIELRYEVLDMEELVNEVTSSMRLQFEKFQAGVNIHSGDDATLEGDRLHLVSVIFNLLDNALKYSSDKPAIDINISTTKDQLVLVISDSGIGIPAEYTNRIFEKFFRVPTGNLHNAKGYGLGLSYVAHVIGKHKGQIRVESIEGDGSKFIISLPRKRS